MAVVSNASPDKTLSAADETSVGPTRAAPRFRENPRTYLAGAALALLTLSAYWNSFAGQFVYDDVDGIVHNAYLRPGLPLDEALRGLVLRQRPVVDLTFLINYRLGELNPWGYHLVNVTLHVLAVLTLFGLVRRILLLPSLRETFGGASRMLAVTVAAIWAVHPLQTQAVTYVVQRSESLCALLYLLTVYCVIRGYASRTSVDRRWEVVSGSDRSAPPVPTPTSYLPTTSSIDAGKSPFSRWFIAAVAACSLGMGAKQVMVTAPLAVLLIDRTLLVGSIREALRRSWRLYVALAATWLLLAMLVLAIPAGKTAGLGTLSFSPWSYLVTQMAVLPRYLRLIVWPTDQVLDYWWPADALSAVWPRAALIVAMVAAGVAAFVMKGRRRWAGLCGVLFFLLLAPTSSLFPINDACVEHRLYLPLAAATALAVCGAYVPGRWLWAKTGWPARAGGILGAAAAVAVLYPLAALTTHRNGLYASPKALWQDVVDKRQNPRAYVNLGLEQMAAGNLPEAEACFKTALALKDEYAEALNNLGTIYFRQRKLDLAKGYFERAIRKLPNFPEAHVNLGQTLALSGRLDEAIAEYRAAIGANPNYADAHCALGMALARKGDVEEALESLARANALTPSARALTEIGAIHERQNNLPEAVKYLERAVRLDDKYVPAQLELGIVLDRQDRVEAAIEHLGRAVTLAPNLAEGFFYLGQSVIKTGDLESAIRWLRRATELNGEFGLAWYRLGALYQQMGNAPEAVGCLRKALKAAGPQPYAAQAHWQLGQALEAQGRLDEAIESYRRAIRSRSDFAEAKESLEKALAKQAQRKK